MKTECNVVLDLLPLYIDGAVSEESKALVEEHLKECAACDTACADMRSRMDAAQPVRAETAAMNQAAHTLRKRRHRRVWRNVLIGLVIGVVLVIAGSQQWNYLAHTSSVPMALDQYQVTLSLREDGESVVASVMSIGHPIRGYASFGDNADGHHVLYLFASQTIIPSPGNANQKYGPEYDKMHFENGMIDGYYEEVRKGTPKEYVTIWKAGENIAPASALMEEYLKMNDTLRNAVVTDNDGRVVRQYLGGLDRFIATGTDMVEVSYPVMTEDEFNTLNNEHLQMRFTVPEWK